jgi:predicted CoA-substrate-specific enzyme activase
MKQGSDHSQIMGLDIGSVAVAIAGVTIQKAVLWTRYGFHHGNLPQTITNLLADIDLSSIRWVAATTSSPSGLNVTCRYDNRIAVIAAARQFHQRVGSILIVGGEKFGLVRFDRQGNYLGYRANTSCAAGTGSFLDQQAERLNLQGVEELGRVAHANTGRVPKIASRCAVFAKTDLVHAQQEGYALAEICDGLCHGLARNIVDTLFVGQSPEAPIIFCGGVSRNPAVRDHIQALVDLDIRAESSHYGAAGAAFCLADEHRSQPGKKIDNVDDLLQEEDVEKTYFYKPLELHLSDYPDFKSLSQYEFLSRKKEFCLPVEVDIYRELHLSSDDTGICRAYLGVDIGSTSTKAVLMDPKGHVIAGFYTRTSGRPVNAVQNLFAAMENMLAGKDISVLIMAAGTTGSGRKFTGRIIGADLIVDEITAHARAAVEINPHVDTIIEIGGQDSKFTTLKNGSVTFSVMNTVCAAGTGSFIEEQARKLGCPLTEFSARAAGRRSPITSDRCTVFMERDINYYIAKGYHQDDVLASVLHAIRENYLTKVAVEKSIGNTILFQGATAKNRALVAAFEQGLEKPIHVSTFCHLSGALGVALKLADAGLTDTTFKGLALHNKSIPIQSEVCELCNNHCKLTVADVDGQTVAYGFLCGRDYDTRQYVNNNASGFNLLKERKRLFAIKKQNKARHTARVGIPAVLHLVEDLDFWKYFFDSLGIETITSEGFSHGLRDGKHLAGAEFCAPMAAMHGHVRHLLERADYIFFPFYLDHERRRYYRRRQYCYYTQYAPSLASLITDPGSLSGDQRHRFLTPLIHYLYGKFYSHVQLYKMVKVIADRRIGFSKVSTAFEKALKFKQNGQRSLKRLYRQETDSAGRLHVVLLGRPYTVLSRHMNKGIPDIFSALGIKTFFQDMITVSDRTAASIAPLLDQLHWYYAAEIVKAAAQIATHPDAYPVLVTSFKCTPDSFVTEYFKQIMERHEKPYLILQLDEHDSTIGYETRIEAAIQSFRNHHEAGKKTANPVAMPPMRRPKGINLTGRTLMLPNWGDISQRLVVANLRREGIDAVLLEERPVSIQKSLRYNTGQCIPLNIIGQEFIDTVERRGLDPARCVLWMIRSAMPCNLGLFPLHIKHLLEKYGNGFEAARVYPGIMSFADISQKLPINIYFAYMFGGFLHKMGCAIRPYERTPGQTNAALEQGLAILVDAFLGRRHKEDALAEVVQGLETIDTVEPGMTPRPKVAIFGDLYARDNAVFNQDLVHQIESCGGEVVTTPYSSYVKMIARPYLRKWFVEGSYLNVLSSKAMITAVTHLERRYEKYFKRILKETEPIYDDPPDKILSPYNIRIENTGESMENVLKIHYLLKHHPEIAMFVQTSPAFCCPSLVTEAMAKEIENNTGVPIVSITYDGTGSNKNEAIIPYLSFLKKSVSGKLARASSQTRRTHGTMA